MFVSFCVSSDHSDFVLLVFVFSVPSQEIGWEERLRNDLFCVKWDVFRWCLSNKVLLLWNSRWRPRWPPQLCICIEITLKQYFSYNTVKCYLIFTIFFTSRLLFCWLWKGEFCFGWSLCHFELMYTKVLNSCLLNCRVLGNTQHCKQYNVDCCTSIKLNKGLQRKRSWEK